MLFWIDFLCLYMFSVRQSIGLIFHFCSVMLVEGTVTSLLEEDGCVTGVQYREKDAGKIKVHPLSHTQAKNKLLFSYIILTLFKKDIA